MAVATLYFARAVLVPFALAMLFSFLLFPVVRQLERLRLPRVPAVLLVVVLAMAVALTVATNVTNQLIDVARAGHHGNGLVAPASNSSEPVSVQVVKGAVKSASQASQILVSRAEVEGR